ncbi:hypothetical protein [Rickettsia tamurae]|uniref:hypothetical protein n=1 Tax=Rickettsia tamurae TaxID=334545 RepID=UPI00308159BF
MLEKIKILKEATTKVYPYFTPSWHNCLRTVGFFSTIILLPIATIIMPMLLFRREENSSLEDKSNNTDLMTLLASAFTVALLNGAQKGISLMLEVSTMHAMMEHNTRRLMDHSKFLIHGDNKDIKSFQYITVGLGIEDFTENVIPIFTELPTYIISSVSTLTYIGITTKSFVTSGIVLGFTVSSGIATYLLSRIYSGYRASNQKIENNLVVKVSFIEAHKSAITLMGTSDQECASVINNLQKIKASIPKLSTIYFVNFFLNTIAPAIASQFLGKYYVDYPDKNLSDTNTAILNIMIMSLLTNMQNIVFILTNNYSYIKLKNPQL